VTWCRLLAAYTVIHLNCFGVDNQPSHPDLHHVASTAAAGGIAAAPCLPAASAAAATPPSPRCASAGRRPAPNLFLICRTLCRDAQLVFFSQNRFVIHDFDCKTPSRPPPEEEAQQTVPGARDEDVGYYSHDQLAASHFLRDVVPPYFLPYLRFLELAFPPYAIRDWPRPGHPAIQDWQTTVEWLRNKLNLLGLTLRLIMTNPLWLTARPERRVMGAADGSAVVRDYCNQQSMFCLCPF
jgi:hypothetical protein